jgi:hypothetical protein
VFVHHLAQEPEEPLTVVVAKGQNTCRFRLSSTREFSKYEKGTPCNAWDKDAASAYGDSGTPRAISLGTT